MLTAFNSDTIISNKVNNLVYTPAEDGLTLYLPSAFLGKKFHIFFMQEHSINISVNSILHKFWVKDFPTKLEIPSQPELVGATFTFEAIASNWRVKVCSPLQTPKYHFKD